MFPPLHGVKMREFRDSSAGTKSEANVSSFSRREKELSCDRRAARRNAAHGDEVTRNVTREREGSNPSQGGGNNSPTNYFERLSQRLSSAMTSAVMKGISSGDASREKASFITVNCLSNIATCTPSRNMEELRPKNLP